MKLSIIVPVYNMAAEGKLEYCLESLLNQTIQDYEIIAVDDGSTDESPEMLRRYQERYPDRFTAAFMPQNDKQGAAKNVGLELCRGDYIGFVDSDDWVLPQMFEKLYCAAIKEDADIVSCDLAYAHEHTMAIGMRIPSMDPANAGELTLEKKRGLLADFGALVTKIYKRELFMEPKLRFPEKMFYEDNAVSTELIWRSKRLVYLEEPMYFYYQHSGSTVHTISEERCRDRMEAMRIMLRLARENGYYESLYPELEYKFFHLFYRITLFSYLQGEGRKNLVFIKSMGQELRSQFPEFRKNKYYETKLDSQEKRLIELQQKSTLLFYVSYRLLWFLRDVRKQLK